MSQAIEFVEKQKHPVARKAALAAMWLQTAPDEELEGNELMARLVAEAVEEAWRHPKTPRMTLVLLSVTRGWKSRDLASILGISPIQYNLLQLGRYPVSRGDVEKIASAQGETPLELQRVLLVTHTMMIGIETAWEMIWQEKLAPLRARERKAKILADKDLQNWGLGELVCAKSLEAEDPDEAVALAELALFIVDHQRHDRGKIQRRHQGYVWGHLGHALQRRGDHAAAETAFADCIELWTTGEGEEKEDRERAERLASIVPSFPPYVPTPRRRKQAKRAGSPTRTPRARRAGGRGSG